MSIMRYCRQIVLGIGLAIIVAKATPAMAQDENPVEPLQGALFAWGDGISGMPYLPPGNGFVAVTGGSSHHIALRADGSVAAWGDNAHGQLNVPDGQ